MFLRSNKLHALAVTALVSLVLSPVSEAKKPAKPPGDDSSGTSYTIVKLDDADGTWRCYPSDVNNLGDTVGFVRDAATSERRAAYWEVSGSGAAIQSEISTLTGGGRGRRHQRLRRNRGIWGGCQRKQCGALLGPAQKRRPCLCRP